MISYIVTVKKLKPATKKLIKFLPLRDDTGHNWQVICQYTGFWFPQNECGGYSF